MRNCCGMSLIPWRGDQGYTRGLPDVLARAAEPGWGHEHEHREPRSPAPHRPAVRHRVAAHRPAPARPGQRGGRSRRGPGPLPRRGRDDHPARLRGPHYRWRRGYPAVPGRAAADPGRRQRPVHRRLAHRVPAVPVAPQPEPDKTGPCARRSPAGWRGARGPGGPAGWAWRHRNHGLPGRASSCRVVLRVPLQGHAFRSHRTQPCACRASRTAVRPRARPGNRHSRTRRNAVRPGRGGVRNSRDPAGTSQAKGAR